MSEKDLLISLMSLPSALGERIEKHFSWVVPAEWKTEVLELQEGTVLPIEVTVTSIDDGVLAQVQTSGFLHGNCVRCLDDIAVPWVVDTADVYLEEEPRKKPVRHSDGESNIEAEGDELDNPLLIQHNQIDLEPLLRDAILGVASLQPLCGPDCLGLCAQCGIRLADAQPSHQHESFDPRFAALENFFSDASDVGDDNAQSGQN